MYNQNKKPRLTLSLNLTDCEQEISSKDIPQSCNYVKPIYSMKNSRRTSIKFSFDQDHLQQSQKKQKKGRLLAEKEALLNSLHALKGGAIMAIAQKQEQIEQLRSQLNSEEMQEEISLLLADKEQLLQQISNLEEKLRSERQSYMRLLEEKDLVIEELYVELESTQVQLEKLQRYVEMKEKQISIISEENGYLLRQLEIENIQKITHHDIEKIEDNRKQEEEQQQNQDLAETGYFMENGLEDEDGEKSELPSQSAVNDHQYRQEIQDLTDYFQKRIAEMRQIYERKLEPLQSQSQSKQSTTNEPLEQVPSLRQTFVNPHQLSKEFITPAQLSDCYSLTRKFDSKACSQKTSTIQRDDNNNFKFFKRAAANPSIHSRTSTNIKQERRPCIVPPKVSELDTSKDKIKDKLVERQPLSIFSSFLLGALTGGSAAFLLSILGKK